MILNTEDRKENISKFKSNVRETGDACRDTIFWSLLQIIEFLIMQITGCQPSQSNRIAPLNVSSYVIKILNIKFPNIISTHVSRCKNVINTLWVYDLRSVYYSKTYNSVVPTSTHKYVENSLNAQWTPTCMGCKI